MNNNIFSAEIIRRSILEGVENLRLRKCRPDRETIAHFVLRKCVGTIGAASQDRIEEIFNEIEQVVDDGLLLKVEYKGTVSYRTPESFDQVNSPLLTKHSKILNSKRTTLQILTTINDLISENVEYCTSGIPWEEVQEHLEKLDSVRFDAQKVEELIKREVSVGTIQLGDDRRVFPKDIKLPVKSASVSESSGSVVANVNGNGTGPSESANAPKKRGRKSNSEKKALQGTNAEDKSKQSGKGAGTKSPKKQSRNSTAIEEKVAEAVKKTFDGRVSGRNKIKRKVFDPSDVPTPTKAPARKKKRSSSSSSVDNCGICNRKMVAKTSVVCSSCASAYHTACLNLPKSALTTAQTEDWFCSDCRKCSVCSGLLKSSNSIECIKCKSGVHSVCAGLDKDYICADCQTGKTSDTSDQNTGSPTRPKRRGVGRPRKSISQDRRQSSSSIENSSENANSKEDVMVSETNSCASKSLESMDTENGDVQEPSTPNLKSPPTPGENLTPILVDGKSPDKWTPVEVEKFFVERGLPDAGALLREQEVDGLSLLLMKRSDVIFGLRLRLGPALKVYKLMLQLQQNAQPQ